MHRRTLGRRRAAFLAAVVTALAGCVGGADPVVTGISDKPPTGDAVIPPALRHAPVAVPGVESCDAVPQQLAPPPATGERLPSLRLPCLVPGPSIDPSVLVGRPVLVNLWATWCGPCREEMPLLQATHLRLGDDVQFLGVNTRDTTEAAAAFLPEVGVTYPQVVDLDGRLLGHLRIPGLPVTVLVDADGNVAARHIGELDPETLEALLDQI